VFRESKGNTEAKFQESGPAFVKHLEGSLHGRPLCKLQSLPPRRSQDVEAERADASAPNTRYSYNAPALRTAA
jgi:hypothetical protein